MPKMLLEIFIICHVESECVNISLKPDIKRNYDQ